MIPALLLLSCGRDPTPAPALAAVPLEGAALIRRESLDLRGVNPSLDELLRLASGEVTEDALVAEWLADPRHETRLVELFAEQWGTLADEFNAPADDFGLGDQEYDFLRSVGQEPLRVLAHVGVSDLPWTEIVTAETTMANDLLAQIWPLEWVDPSQTEGWREARYVDGRPAGGVLMSNGLWWRYDSTANNLNRGRAAAVSRLLFCYDFLARPVAFSGFTEFSAEALLAATKTDPNCEACHSGLDPLAATLFGFWWFDTKDATEMSRYHPEREQLGQTFLELEPAVFGVPIAGTSQLGEAVASDPRFTRCAVEQVARGLWRREPDAADISTLNDLNDAFEAGDLRLSALIRATLQTESYRAGALGEAATDEDAARLRTRRLLSVGQLASAVEDLTGYRWTSAGYDQLDNDLIGYRVMAGGVDGDTVRTVGQEPTVSRVLVERALAQGAASAVVEDDLAADPQDRRLFPASPADLLSLTEADPAFDEVLDHLHLRIHAALPDDDQRAAERALFSQVSALAGPQAAWTSLVSVMLRDPLFWSY